MNNVLDDKIDIFLEFDKDSIIYNKNMKGINRVRILIFSIFSFFLYLDKSLQLTLLILYRYLLQVHRSKQYYQKHQY